MGAEVHPRTNTGNKFIVEDRFHGSTSPHKVKGKHHPPHHFYFVIQNELCRFHSANWCPQLNSLATSQQEHLNSLKNKLRLRRTCTQRPERHLMYNMVCYFCELAPLNQYLVIFMFLRSWMSTTMNIWWRSKWLSMEVCVNLNTFIWTSPSRTVVISVFRGATNKWNRLNNLLRPSVPKQCCSSSLNVV